MAILRVNEVPTDQSDTMTPESPVLSTRRVFQ